MLMSKFDKLYKQIIAESTISTSINDLPLQDISKDYPFYVIQNHHHIVRGVETQEEGQEFIQNNNLDKFYFSVVPLEYAQRSFKDLHDKFNWGSEYRTNAEELNREYNTPNPWRGGNYRGD